jgi:hypothetical protein
MGNVLVAENDLLMATNLRSSTSSTASRFLHDRRQDTNPSFLAVSSRHSLCGSRKYFPGGVLANHKGSVMLIYESGVDAVNNVRDSDV